MATIATVFALVGLVLATIAVFQAKGQGVLPWAVAMLGLALCWSFLSSL